MSSPYAPTDHVIATAGELHDLLANDSRCSFCLYVADKTPALWRRSVSRIYMNSVDPAFKYVPVNIGSRDDGTLIDVYELARAWSSVAGINFTHPHKSSSLLRSKYHPYAESFDCLVKDRGGDLRAHDLNGPSFVTWLDERRITIRDTKVAIVGIGGAGSSIARQVATLRPACLYLIDIRPAFVLAEELCAECPTVSSPTFPEYQGAITIINATGKSSTARGDGSAPCIPLSVTATPPGRYIDLDPTGTSGFLMEAAKAGWETFDGADLSAINDHSLLRLLSEYSQIEVPPLGRLKAIISDLARRLTSEATL